MGDPPPSTQGNAHDHDSMDTCSSLLFSPSPLLSLLLFLLPPCSSQPLPALPTPGWHEWHGLLVNESETASSGGEDALQLWICIEDGSLRTDFNIMGAYVIDGKLNTEKGAIHLTQTFLATDTQKHATSHKARDFSGTISVGPHDDDPYQLTWKIEGTYLATLSGSTKKSETGSFFVEVHGQAPVGYQPPGLKRRSPNAHIALPEAEMTWEPVNATTSSPATFASPLASSSIPPMWLRFHAARITSTIGSQCAIEGRYDEDADPPTFAFTAVGDDDTRSFAGRIESTGATGNATSDLHAIRLRGVHIRANLTGGVHEFLGACTLKIAELQPATPTRSPATGTAPGTPLSDARRKKAAELAAAVGSAPGSALMLPRSVASSAVSTPRASEADLVGAPRATIGEMRAPSLATSGAPAKNLTPEQEATKAAADARAAATAKSLADARASAAAAADAAAALRAKTAAEAAERKAVSEARIAAAQAAAAAATAAAAASREKAAEVRSGVSRPPSASVSPAPTLSRPASIAATNNVASSLAGNNAGSGRTSGTFAPSRTTPPVSRPESAATTAAPPSLNRQQSLREQQERAQAAVVAATKAAAAAAAEAEAAAERRVQLERQRVALERKKQLELVSAQRKREMDAEAARLRALDDAVRTQRAEEREARLAEIEASKDEIAAAVLEEEARRRDTRAEEIERRRIAAEMRERAALSKTDATRRKPDRLSKTMAADDEDYADDSYEDDAAHPSSSNGTGLVTVGAVAGSRSRATSPAGRASLTKEYDTLKTQSEAGILAHIFELLAVRDPAHTQVQVQTNPDDPDASTDSLPPPPPSAPAPTTPAAAATLAVLAPAVLPLTLLYSPSGVPESVYHTDAGGVVRCTPWSFVDARQVFTKFETNVLAQRPAGTRAADVVGDLAAQLVVIDGSQAVVALTLLEVGALLKNGLASLAHLASGEYAATPEGFILQSFVFPDAATIPPPGSYTPPPRHTVYRCEFAAGAFFECERRVSKHALHPPSSSHGHSHAARISLTQRIASYKCPDRDSVSESVLAKPVETRDPFAQQIDRDLHGRLRKMCVAIIKRINDKCKVDDGQQYHKEEQ